MKITREKMAGKRIVIVMLVFSAAICPLATAAGISDHVLKIEMSSTYNYDYPGVPLNYDFDAWIQVDATVVSGSLQVPGGSVYPMVYESDGVKTWLGVYINGSDPSVWDDFGAGTYTFTVNYVSGPSDSTSIDYQLPNGDPIPYVTQEPQFVYPQHDAIDVPLDCTLQFNPATNPDHTIDIWIEPVGGTPGALSYDIGGLSHDTSSYGPVTLSPETLYEGGYSINHCVTTINADGIPVVMDTDAETEIHFTTGMQVIASPEAPFYQVQTVPFPVPSTGEFVFIKNTDGVNSWAGEDPGALVKVGINDNIDSQGLGVPVGGFSGSQGAVVVYNVSGDAGNGEFCALSSAFPTSEGGPGASGLPLNLNDVVLRVDIAFDVPGHPEIMSLTKALNFWVQEVDGDNFELSSSGCFDLSRNWQTYEYELDNLPLEFLPGGVFGDSSATLVSVEFEDPVSPTGLDTIIYFIDNFRLEKSGETLFFEDFESPVDIHSISLTVTEYRLDGVPGGTPYEFSTGVNGDNITAVTMTPPGKDAIALIPWPTGQYGWGLSVEDYETLTALRADFPIGDYTFTFNGGNDSVTVSHNPTAPTGFANVTYPVHGSSDVPLNPTFTWSYTGNGDALTMALADEKDYGIIYVEQFANISQTSWAPGPLEPGHLYSLEVSVFTGSTPSGLSYGTDDYNYYDLFENCNEVLFTASECCHPADKDCNYVISMLEILGYIDEWAVGDVSMLEVLEAIDLWAAGQYYCDESGNFKPGVKL